VLTVSLFLREQIYGRSRIPPLSALLQRQFRPVPPSPFRPDALLIQPPEWFEARVAELEELQFFLVLRIEIALRANDD
jgi:hypothetical protein